MQHATPDDATPNAITQLQAAATAMPDGVCCLDAARQLISAFNWQLLSEAEFAQRATEAHRQTPALSPRQACQNAYAVVLYEACCDRDARRQAQAYTELHGYLHRIAYHRWYEIADEVAQEAILLVYRDIAKVKKPGAFLYFAWCKLLHATQRVRPDPRLQGGLPDDDQIPWRQPDEDPGSGARARSQDTAASMEETLPWADPGDLRLDSADDVRVDRLWDCLRTIWKRHTGAHDQIRAFMWKHYDGLSEAEICRRLNQTPAHVQILRSRAKARLSQCLEDEVQHR